VPQEFQTQYPSYANPPTLAMALTSYINRLKAAGVSLASLDIVPHPPSDTTGSSSTLSALHITSPQLASQYLTSIYSRLKRHYEWFRETQRGQIREWGREARSRKEGYRWRGRTMDHVLTSGLDDYPRAKPPHLGELHLDLISWMAFFSKTMSEIAEFLGEEEERKEFEGNAEMMRGNIEGQLGVLILEVGSCADDRFWGTDLHWSEEQQMYCDASVDEDGLLSNVFSFCHPSH
ncbi:hypothetical protein P7C70_g9647, partial [Phenoliferia sp. Uapishka_3]